MSLKDIPDSQDSLTILYTFYNIINITLETRHCKKKRLSRQVIKLKSLIDGLLRVYLFSKTLLELTGNSTLYKNNNTYKYMF